MFVLVEKRVHLDTHEFKKTIADDILMLRHGGETHLFTIPVRRVEAVDVAGIEHSSRVTGIARFPRVPHPSLPSHVMRPSLELHTSAALALSTSCSPRLASIYSIPQTERSRISRLVSRLAVYPAMPRPSPIRLMITSTLSEERIGPLDLN